MGESRPSGGGVARLRPQPSRVAVPVGRLSLLGWDGFGGHVYMFAYVCAWCMCVYLYIYMHICAQAHVCVGMYICK